MADIIDAPAETLTDDERRSLREGCDRAVQGDALRTAADALTELAILLTDDLTADEYGEGGAVAVLETEVRELFGKPAAVFLPSGTMAQQIALRIHADRRGRRVIAFHPTSHLELHEDYKYRSPHPPMSDSHCPRHIRHLLGVGVAVPYCGRPAFR